MPSVIPLQPVPGQVLAVTLGGQPCTLVVVQKSTGLFMDLYVNATLIVAGVICENANPLVRGEYLGFVGNLAFFDTEGTEDPYYDGLGSRWRLVYEPTL